MKIKIILLLLLLYIAFELGLFVYKYFTLPELPNIDQSEKILGTGPELRYIAAGDSTAVGVGASTAENTYAYAIAQTLAKTRTVQYKNIGVKGYTTTDVLNNQLKEVIAFKPDVVTISMGGNDATHLVSADKILANYKAIIAELKEKTSAQIYITNIPHFKGASVLPWFYIAYLESRSSRLNPQILALEDDRVQIINIHDFGWSQFPDIKTTYAADHFHPNDIGYENWTAAFLDKIIPNSL